MTTYSPEMRERALRMLAAAAADHPNLWTIRHVAGLLGMSPETLRLWQRKVGSTTANALV
ncbi:helix-turn-helix domain-containing protein [Curtobacterium sp. ISL-83]|uniref:helix-turn-helix domain-containing protein n=1 Tax=Curtobacterium sp. ISL-83 TaxID=2819145 RepID=UPI001BE7E784|nr:helix-turn-helix domain-containing protein [Curtobacterium sp. ISL-83]MBT2504167.1 helix-turn-helix domain-containing protein [Curtobacterium sp. ISL-83]